MHPESHRIQTSPSVLDRLLDDAPKNQVENLNAMGFDLSHLKRSVARDIEALLNARSVDLDENIQYYPQARSSMIDYGITDLSSLSLLDPGDRAYLRDKIRITVERHEPRLGAVRVHLGTPSGTERMLRFRVDALLKIHPTRPPVSFDATLQLSSNSCKIKEA